jgi:hypothetical protein
MSTQWITEVRPVLEAVYQATREHPEPRFGVDQKNINAVLGRDPDDVSTALALDNLIRGGYLVEGPMARMGSKVGPTTVLLTEKAYTAVAGWPSSSGEALLSSLIAELDRRIEAAEPEERNKLERFRDFAVGIGRDVLVGVLTHEATS